MHKVIVIRLALVYFMGISFLEYISGEGYEERIARVYPLYVKVLKQ